MVPATDRTGSEVRGMIYIGIDPGVHTGFAFWSTESQSLRQCCTVSIVEAMQLILSHRAIYNIKIVFEDARKRKWYGKKGREALQGAGSIKRDCAIWQEFCEHYGITYEAVAPSAGSTKWTAAQFKAATGWTGRTSEHSRDAAILVWRRK